jgi:hypothetical protein
MFGLGTPAFLRAVHVLKCYFLVADIFIYRFYKP